jgi:hypothetical protein
MKMSRLGASAAAGLMLAAMGVAGATTASATTYVFHFECDKYVTTAGTWEYVVTALDQNGTYVGEADFNADPADGMPGDALRAVDGFPDGYGVIAHLSTGRTASTRGHSSPYTTPWATGNLPENTHYTIWAEMVKGDEGTVSQSCSVTS